jgi:hypothetical protein
LKTRLKIPKSMALMIKTKIIAISESCWLFEGTRHRLNFVKNFGKKANSFAKPRLDTVRDASMAKIWTTWHVGHENNAYYGRLHVSGQKEEINTRPWAMKPARFRRPILTRMKRLSTTQEPAPTSWQRSLRNGLDTGLGCQNLDKKNTGSCILKLWSFLLSTQFCEEFREPTTVNSLVDERWCGFVDAWVVLDLTLMSKITADKIGDGFTVSVKGAILKTWLKWLSKTYLYQKLKIKRRSSLRKITTGV